MTSRRWKMGRRCLLDFTRVHLSQSPQTASVCAAYKGVTYPLAIWDRQRRGTYKHLFSYQSLSSTVVVGGRLRLLAKAGACHDSLNNVFFSLFWFDESRWMSGGVMNEWWINDVQLQASGALPPPPHLLSSNSLFRSFREMHHPRVASKVIVEVLHGAFQQHRCNKTQKTDGKYPNKKLNGNTIAQQKQTTFCVCVIKVFSATVIEMLEIIEMQGRAGDALRGLSACLWGTLSLPAVYRDLINTRDDWHEAMPCNESILNDPTFQVHFCAVLLKGEMSRKKRRGK